jgi:aspartyl protease family protein
VTEVRAAALAALLALAPHSGSLAGPSVSLNGHLGPQAALLVIDGQVRTVRVGQSLHGVKLLSLSDGQAVVEIEGRRVNLSLGATPVALGGGINTSSAGRIVMRADSGGHFMTPGSINGRPTRFMVDTGATSVTLGAAEAQALGLRFQDGQRVLANTANGTVQGYAITLERLRIGDVEVYGVPALVLPASTPTVLLGNSYLNRFKLRRENDTLTLDRAY